MCQMTTSLSAPGAYSMLHRLLVQLSRSSAIEGNVPRDHMNEERCKDLLYHDDAARNRPPAMYCHLVLIRYPCDTSSRE